jgi:hypothetical protein
VLMAQSPETLIRSGSSFSKGCVSSDLGIELSRLRDFSMEHDVNS